MKVHVINSAGLLVWKLPEPDMSLLPEELSYRDDLTFDPVSIEAYFLGCVREEASRRIQLLYNARDKEHLSHIITNEARETIQLMKIGSAHWTPSQAQRAALLEQRDTALDALRQASNSLESMVPIPLDYRDDKYW